MANFAYMPADLANADHTLALYDDFTWFVTAHNWTSTLTDSGTASITAGTTDVSLAASDGTVADNDEAYVATTNAAFLPAAGRNLYFETKIKFTEANTDDANVAAGLASSVAANLIVDDGAGMRASGTVFAIYKVDGGTAWVCVSRNGSTAYTNTSGTTRSSGSYQTLGIEIVELLSTTCTVTFKVDGQILRDATTGQPIRHQILYSGLSNCQAFVGVKNGDTNLETLHADYIGVVQAR